MKKLYFIVLLFALSTLVFGQSRKYETAVIDSGTTISDSVKAPDGYFLSQINVPTMEATTDTISFLVGLSFDEYWYNGAKHIEIIKSAGDCIVGMNKRETENIEWFKVVADITQTSNRTLTYTFERK